MQVCGTRGRPGIGVVLSERWPPPGLKLPQNERRWLLLPVLGAASTASITMLDQGRGCHGEPIAEGQNTDVELWMGSFSCCLGITKGQNTDVEPWTGSSLCFLGTLSGHSCCLGTRFGIDHGGVAALCLL